MNKPRSAGTQREGSVHRSTASHNFTSLLTPGVWYLYNSDADVLLVSSFQPFMVHGKKRITGGNMLLAANPETSLAQEMLFLYCLP